MCFSVAASSENDHGSMNLASNTAPVSLTKPSSVAAIQGMVRWTAWRWISEIRWPEFCSYQRQLRSSVANPSWTIRRRQDRELLAYGMGLELTWCASPNIGLRKYSISLSARGDLGRKRL